MESNLGLSMSHRLNYEAVALTTRPPRLDRNNSIAIFELKKKISFCRIIRLESIDFVDLKSHSALLYDKGHTLKKSVLTW